MIELNIIVDEKCPRGKDGLVNMQIVEVASNNKSSIKIRPIKWLDKLPFNPTESSLEILYFSTYIHLIDNLVSRKRAADDWMREIKVTMPVANPALWSQQADILSDALNFLTGDEWEISFCNLEEKYHLAQKLPTYNKIEVQKVSLLSGGLDSLVGAIDMLSECQSVLFVSHNDGKGANSGEQQKIIGTFKTFFPTKHILTSQLHIFQGSKFNCGGDSNQRARSILFLGLALFNAMNYNLGEVHIPENGLISINLPLNESRSVSNSTRTTHPYFIAKFQEFLTNIGVMITIRNPYQFKTKGEMLKECKNKELLNDLLDRTISCSHSKRQGTWTRRGAIKNCGYCIPCLIRRASIFHYNNTLDLDDHYGVQLNYDELKLDSSRSHIDLDVLALINFLNKNHDVNSLKREIALTANIENKHEIAEMLHRGYEELRTFIRSRSDKFILRMLNS